MDLLRELKAERWNVLVSQTLLELASCFKKLNDDLSYTKTCAAISCCIDLEILVRTFYFDEFLKSLRSIQPILGNSEQESNSFVHFEDHFKIYAIHLINNSPIIQDSLVSVEIKLESNFPREILCEIIELSFDLTGKFSDNDSSSNEFEILPFSMRLDFKQDSSLNCASVACDLKRKVRRTSGKSDNNFSHFQKDFKHSVLNENVLIHPGINTITLSTNACEVGSWAFKQISVKYQKIDYLSKYISIEINPFDIITKPSSASLHFSDLVAGLDQEMKLFVSGGSFHFPKETNLILKCSKGLRLKTVSDADYQKILNIKIRDFKLFEQRNIELTAICDLPCRRDEVLIDHKVILSCPWSECGEIQIPLKFLPILTASCRLHSSGSKKFLQVITKSLYDNALILANAVMKCTCDGIIIADLNPKSQNELVIRKNISISYLYEIEVEPLKTLNELPVINIEFSLLYSEIDKPSIIRKYVCPFDVTDYHTLYCLKLKISTDPQSEICRVGSVCHLILTITKSGDNKLQNDLMYEVLYDQSMWALYGRSAGVVSMTDFSETTITLDVFPLIPGYLPLPNVRLSKYIANKSKNDHPKLIPFAPTQVYNSTKSLQIHVLNNVEQ